MAQESPRVRVEDTGSLFAPPPAPETRTPWLTVVIVAVILAIIIAVAVMMTRAPQRHAAAPNAYAQKVALSDLKLSQAQNFVGAMVTYLDGNLTNNGDRTLIGATIQATFRNSLNEVVQQDEQPLRILRRSGAYPEALDLLTAPVAPHQTREFRLTFEHISADWNHELPELRILDAATR
jgi:hypothetical protein